MNHTRTIHRFTAGLLCIIMVLTLTLISMPQTAFAVGENKLYILHIRNGSISNEYGANEDKIIVENPGWVFDETSSQILTIPNTITILGVLDGNTIEIHYIDSNISIVNYGTITGGEYRGPVTNYGTITGGIFYSTPVNKGSSASFGGDARVAKTLTTEVKGGTASLGIVGNEDASECLKNNGRGFVGTTYNLRELQGELIGLYLLGKDDEIPQAPYSIDTEFRPIFGGISYDFDMPDKDTTVYVVYKGYGGDLTIAGVIEDESFNFEKDRSGQEYLFGLLAPPNTLKTYEWSIIGTLPKGLSLLNSTTAAASIGGTPTEATDNPVTLTVCVRATAENGDVYCGEADILISVYVPENPFAEAETLLKAADCIVPMETANTATAISDWLSGTWLNGIEGLATALGDSTDASRLSVVLNNDFTAATKGTASDPDGTDGSVTFSVNYYGEDIVCENLTCTIKATAFEHSNIVKVDEVPATHLADGNIEYWYCSGCEKYFSDAAGTTEITLADTVVQKLTAHTYDIESTDAKYLKAAADCKNAAVYYKFCSCGEKGTQTFTSGSINPANHTNLNRIAAVPATHLADGNIEYWYCSGCDKYFSDAAGTAEITLADTVVPKLTSHTYDIESTDAKYLKTAADCKNAAVYYKSCICGEKGTQTFTSGGLNFDNHVDLVKISEVPATHLADGNIEYWYCSGCDMHFKDTANQLVPISRAATVVTKLTAHSADASGWLFNVNSHWHVCTCSEKFDYGDHSLGEWTQMDVDTGVSGSVSRVCSVCGYMEVRLCMKFGDSDTTNESIGFSGHELSESDSLIVERNPSGSAYDDLRSLADSSDVFATYDIYLGSGKKSFSFGSNLDINLKDEIEGSEFTLVHQKANGTYEYFYDTADANGDLTFGPLYELSPFMLVRGTLTPPQESDSDNPKTDDNSNLWLWVALMFVSGGAVTSLGVIGKRRRKIK